MRDAVRFWEPRRAIYNAVLAAFVLAWSIGTWPHFKPGMTWPNFGRVAVLAILANVGYSAAYLVEIAMGTTESGDAWHRGRRIVWIAGLVLSVLFENTWIADEIYPFVR